MGQEFSKEEGNVFNRGNQSKSLKSMQNSEKSKTDTKKSDIIKLSTKDGKIVQKIIKPLISKTKSNENEVFGNSSKLEGKKLKKTQSLKKVRSSTSGTDLRKNGTKSNEILPVKSSGITVQKSSGSDGQPGESKTEEHKSSTKKREEKKKSKKKEPKSSKSSDNLQESAVSSSKSGSFDIVLEKSNSKRNLSTTKSMSDILDDGFQKVHSLFNPKDSKLVGSAKVVPLEEFIKLDPAKRRHEAGKNTPSSVSSTSLKAWRTKSLSPMDSSSTRSSSQSLYLPSNESMVLLDTENIIAGSGQNLGPVKLTLDRGGSPGGQRGSPSSESVQSETYAMTMAEFLPQYRHALRKKGRRGSRRGRRALESSDSDESIKSKDPEIVRRPRRSISGKISELEFPSTALLIRSLKNLLSHGFEVTSMCSYDSEVGVGLRHAIDSKIVDSSVTTAYATEFKTLKPDGKGNYTFS